MRYLFFIIWCTALLLPATIYSHTAGSVVYTYPEAGAEGVSRTTSIGIRYSQILSDHFPAASFTVTGSKSGLHSGSLRMAEGNTMAIFSPDKPFTLSEQVTVRISSLPAKDGSATRPASLEFSIVGNEPVKPQNIPAGIFSTPGTGAKSLRAEDALPSDFPILTAHSNQTPAPGKIYMADWLPTVMTPGGGYLLILGNDGSPVHYRSTFPFFAADFKPHKNGLYTYFDLMKERYYALDSNLNLVDSFQAANGYSLDGHEFRFLPNGGYVLLANQIQTVDMRDFIPYGDSTALVTYDIIQEFDAKKNLVFEWSTRNHFQITDTYEDLSFAIIDYVHANSIEFDTDSTYILSARAMDEVTKISRKNGNIIWRLGGKNNQFHFINDAFPFSHQHSVYKTSAGTLLMFDNGNLRANGNFSRAVEYKLDENAKTSTKIWEYRHTPDYTSPSEGSAQRLNNGNTFIGWGECDDMAVTEVKPDGTIVFELSMLGFRGTGSAYSYRALKYEQTTISSVAPDVSSPDRLGQNFPNPARELSVIPVTATETESAQLTLYDALGRVVRTLFSGTMTPGSYTITFNAAALMQGTYYYRLTTTSHTETRSMVIVK